MIPFSSSFFQVIDLSLNNFIYSFNYLYAVAAAASVVPPLRNPINAAHCASYLSLNFRIKYLIAYRNIPRKLQSSKSLVRIRRTPGLFFAPPSTHPFNLQEPSFKFLSPSPSIQWHGLMITRLSTSTFLILIQAILIHHCYCKSSY